MPHSFSYGYFFLKVMQGNLQQKNWDLKAISTATACQLAGLSETINLKLF